MKQICYLLVAFVIFAGCGSSSSSTSTIQKSITISRGGGVSGAYTGYTLTAAGKVTKWQQLPSEEKKTTDLFTTTADSAGFFFRYLDEAGFRSTEFSTPGNMTTMIQLDSGSTLHTIKWGNSEVTPPVIFQSFYDLLTNYIQRRIK
jgi:hypothetical protein